MAQGLVTEPIKCLRCRHTVKVWQLENGRIRLDHCLSADYSRGEVTRLGGGDFGAGVTLLVHATMNKEKCCLPGMRPLNQELAVRSLGS